MVFQGNTEDTGSAAQATADDLKQLLSAARGIAATVPAGSSVLPSDVLDAASDILDKSSNLIAAAKTAISDPDNPNSKAQLTQVFAFSHILLYTVCGLCFNRSQLCLFCRILISFRSLNVMLLLSAH